MTPREARAARYREWLETHGLRFGFAGEIAAQALRSKAGVSNDVPPADKWERIVATAKVLERVRETFGATTIHSAYRAPAYNVLVGGVGDSQHSHNTALDFSCANGTPAAWGAFLRGLRVQGVFTGGVGVYTRQGFCHVDTRGTLADWGA